MIMGVYPLRQYVMSILLAAVAMSFPNALHAQSTACTVEGIVRDTTGIAVPYVVVSVFTGSPEGTTTGQAVGTAVTDDDGFWSIPLPGGGCYLIRCEHMAFETCDSLVVVGEETVRHETVLVPSTEYIEAVAVIGTPIKYSAGKYEISLSDSELTRNRSVSDVLDRLPGVSFWKGVAEIHGTPVAHVYIDGREVNNMKELEALRGENIDKIEIRNSTGSAYSAAERGGIIRITLKRLNDRGYIFTPSVSPFMFRAGKETDCSFGGGVSAPFSAKIGKWNVYNFLNGSLSNHRSVFYDDAQYISAGYDLYSRKCSTDRIISVYDALSVVYEIDDMQNFGIKGVFVAGDSGPETRTSTVVGKVSESAILPDYSSSEYSAAGNVGNMQFLVGMNYDLELDSLGSGLYIKADYVHRDIDKVYDYVSEKFDADGTLRSSDIYRELYSPTLNGIRARGDFSKVFAAGRSVDAGLTFSFDDADDRTTIKRMEGSGLPAGISEITRFRNRNYVGTAYAVWNDRYGRFSYSVGASMQWDRISAVTENGPSIDRDYIRPFGSISLGYAINPQRGTNLNLDVARLSGDSPTYDMLSPRVVRESEYDWFVGNGNLKPATGYNASLTYLWRGCLSVAYGWTRGFDIPVRITRTLPSSTDRYITYENEGTSLRHSLYVSYNASLTEWLRVDARLSAYWARETYDKYAVEAFGGNVSANLGFTISPTAGADLRVAYYSPRNSIDFSSSADLRGTLSAYKTFFDGRLTCMLSLELRGFDMVTTERQLDGSYIYTERYVATVPLESVCVTIGWNFARNPQRVKTVRTLQEAENVSR